MGRMSLVLGMGDTVQREATLYLSTLYMDTNLGATGGTTCWSHLTKDSSFVAFPLPSRRSSDPLHSKMEAFGRSMGKSVVAFVSKHK